MSFWGFVSRDLGIGKYKRLALRYPECRNTETPYLICSIIILGSRKSGFQDMRRHEVSHLGFLGAETPNHISPKLTSRFRKSRFHDVRQEEVSHMGFPGSKTMKFIYIYIYIYIYTLRFFRGFGSQEFTTCEYKETCPWVSRVSKR
jgi:hypothetical protein